MEFKVYQKELELQFRGWVPTFHDVSKEIMEIVKEIGVKNGTVCIASHHITCSVMIQESSHDLTIRLGSLFPSSSLIQYGEFAVHTWLHIWINVGGNE